MRAFRQQLVNYQAGSMVFPMKVRRARVALTIDGSAKDVIQALRGVTVGCSLSVAVGRAENASRLPFKLVAPPMITTRRAYLPCKLDKHGWPCECYVYEHPYRRITEANDKGTLAALVRAHPQVMERPLQFTPVPRDTHREHKRGTGTARGKGAGKMKIMRAVYRGHVKGAAKRALTAGLINPAVYKHMQQHGEL